MQKERTFSLAIERHDDGYLASFPALPGCNTWGVTYEEAVKNAEEALAVYLETFSEHGDSMVNRTQWGNRRSFFAPSRPLTKKEKRH
jgi:predicted RNase H-like HicB family nuclease